MRIKKLYQGKYASIRDYIVNDALVLGKDIVLEYGTEVMTIKTGDLHKGLRLTNEKYTSKFDSTLTYSMINFPWTPDSHNQLKFNGL